MQIRERICRHCKKPYTCRAGRGLCRHCWENPLIKAKYQPLAGFGGRAAQEFATVKAKDL